MRTMPCARATLPWIDAETQALLDSLSDSLPPVSAEAFLAALLGQDSSLTPLPPTTAWL